MNYRSLRWVVVIALLVVYSAAVFSTQKVPAKAYFGGDVWEYQSMAVNFAAGHGLRFGALMPFEDYAFGTASPALLARFEQFGAIGGVEGGNNLFFRAPAYPFLLGLLYKVVGVRPQIAVGIQFALLVGIAALLPMLGEGLLGRGGFLAGVMAGAAFLQLESSLAGQILTETLIAVAIFLVLAAWVPVGRQPRSRARAALLGLALAFGVLVKGSLALLPVLFLGYLAVQTLRGKDFGRALLVAALVFALPVAAYSAYASVRSSALVVLTTQGRAVLLDGNNERSVQSGGWHPEWKTDPQSFYRQRLRAAPGSSGIALVAAFYSSRPQVIPRVLVNKLAAMVGRDVRGLWVAFVALSLVYAAGGVGAGRATGAGWRRSLGALVDDAPMVGPLIVIVNFVVLTLITFGEPRFVAPSVFVLAMADAFLAVRLLELVELPIEELTKPRSETEGRTLSTYYFHARDLVYERIADELACLTRYSGRLFYVGATAADASSAAAPGAGAAVTGDDILFGCLVGPRKTRLPSWRDYPGGADQADWPDTVVLDGTLNSSLDIQEILATLKPRLSRGDRLVAILYNPYYAWLYRLLDRLGLRHGPDATTFITRVDLAGLASISGFEVVRLRPAANVPLRLAGLGRVVNGLLAAIPGLRRLAPVDIATLRPLISDQALPSLSVVIPARNERGNIEAALERMPRLPGVGLEIIFVEGHSTDGTWEEIERACERHRCGPPLSAHQQTGVGKADAVRLGFAKAKGDLVTILDADLSVPPEMLGRFYEAYAQGLGDFINGSRLVYPIEGRAMRTANRLGNIFFAKTLSRVLDVRLSDTLCGTKLLSRRDYERMVAWREDFGDLDPFGDFELLFPAAALALGVVNVPIHYRDRTYGSTNISRFRHGLMLARMAAVGFVRIKMGLGRRAGQAT